MTHPPVTPQRTPDGFGCLVCYLLLCGVLALPVLLVNGPALVRAFLRPAPVDVEAETVEAELAAFARAVCPELQAEIDALADREAVDRQRCDALRDLLLRLGHKPDDDHDYAAWRRELDATAARLAAARLEREDRFLTARKAALRP